MLSNNVPTTFSVEENDFFPVSGRSGLTFNAHLMHSLMEDRVISLNDLLTTSTERLVEQIFINKI